MMPSSLEGYLRPGMQPGRREAGAGFRMRDVYDEEVYQPDIQLT